MDGSLEGTEEIISINEDGAIEMQTTVSTNNNNNESNIAINLSSDSVNQQPPFSPKLHLPSTHSFLQLPVTHTGLRSITIGSGFKMQPENFSLTNFEELKNQIRKTKPSGEPIVDHKEIDVKIQDLTSHIKEKSRVDKTGILVEVSNLSYYIKKKVKKTESIDGKNTTEKHYLLNDLSFYLKPGRMVLLMGAPSSGKSLLLKVLANRMGKGKLEGKLLFNQHEIDPDTHQRDTIYVAQEDRHIPLLTVRQTIEFSARCNMGESASEQDISERVDIILDQLGISHTQNTIIGNEFFRGISGGQKRRVTVASEFTKCPNLMLLDEPTTGLDSAISYSLLSKIKCITQEAKTSTLVSLLQPSPELTGLFDDVILLSEGGTLAFFGPYKTMLPYFKSISIQPLPNQPTAEFMQEVVFEPNKYLIGNESNSNLRDSIVNSEGINFRESIVNNSTININNNNINIDENINLSLKFKESRDYEILNLELKNLYSNDLKLVDSSMEKDKINLKSNTWYETKLCLARHIEVMKIMKYQYFVRFLQALFMGFVVGTLFYQMSDSQADARNRFGLLYFSMVLHIWTCIGCIEEYFSLRSIFYDQNASKYYGPFPFFLSLTITKIPIAFIEALLYSTMCYWLAGFRATGDAFIIFVLGMTLTNLISQGIFQTVSVFLENVLISALVNPAVVVICMIMSGYMLPKPNIPGWYIWLHYLTPLKYVMEMLSSNEMVDRKFTCSPSEFIPPLGTEGFNNSQICPGSNGNDFLHFFGMPENSYFRWIDLVISIAYIFALFTIFYLGIRFIRFESKRPPKFIKPKKYTQNKAEKHRQSKHIMTGCYMTFNNLGYTVESKKKNLVTKKKEKVTLQLLKGISGFVTPGMMALMGASGAGKSTLLDVFSRRKNMGVMSGEIKINNRSIDSVNLTRFTGYVEQMDILPSNLTVREAIEFNAKCRLPSTISERDERKMIDNIIKVLSLKKIENMKIGTNPTNGISLANRKKVSIGIELSADPQLLFLDEPTSSLDSTDALKVMNCVKRIANSGKTVICTIHQPSAEIFEKFDQLLLLDKGQTIYFGETGKNSETVLEYFTSQGYKYTPGRNPADFMLEISEKHNSTHSNFTHPIEYYRDSQMAQNVLNRLTNDYPSIVPIKASIPNFVSQYSSTFSVMLRCLLRRSWLNHIRRPQTILLRFLRSFIPSIILGTMFVQLDNDQPGARNKVAMVYLSFLFAGMASIGKIPLVIEDRAVYYRDRSSNTYPSILYLIASFITDLPMMVMTSFCFWIPFFWLTGLDGGHDGWKFFFTLGVYTLVIICYDNLSMFFAFTLPTVPIATLINSMSLNFVALFGGFFIPRTSIKSGWIWMYHLVFSKYGLESLCVTVLQGQEFYCKEGQSYPIPIGNNQTKEYCPIINGETMLNQYGFDSDRQFINVVILTCYAIAYLFFCYLSIVFIKHMKR